MKGPEIVFFLEEESAQALLETLVPRLVPEEKVAVRYVVFEGKSDLHKRLGPKLRHYLNRQARFIVLRDKDAADCYEVKRQLVTICADAGRPEAIIRIACHELESWYLADLAAVAQAHKLPKLTHLQAKQKYRAPDNLPSPSREMKEIVPDFRKVGSARLIGPYMELGNQRSTSFRALINGIRRCVDELVRAEEHQTHSSSSG